MVQGHASVREIPHMKPAGRKPVMIVTLRVEVPYGRDYCNVVSVLGSLADKLKIYGEVELKSVHPESGLVSLHNAGGRAGENGPKPQGIL